MIVIHSPEIIVEGDEVILSSELLIEGEEQRLWYRFPQKFRPFLVTERLDAIVVGLLPLALKFGLDIKVEGAISSRLYYTLNHYLINALCLGNPEFNKVQIHADRRESANLNVANVAGTGLSCGVDSFATYYDHIDEETPYKIEYFTFFNAGSHGDFGGEKAREVFYKRLDSVKEFAAKVEKEVIPIDSNLSDILRINFQKTHTLRSVSCVLLLQKLFRNYYYASSVKFDQFKLDKVRIAEYDLLNLQMLSTESTNIFSSVAQYNRIERIELVAKEPDTFSFLDVCTNPQLNGAKINCSECKKCIQTLFTLEVLGYLENYENAFDIKKFLRNKPQYLGSLLFREDKETLDIQLLELMKERKVKVPTKSYCYGLKWLILNQKKNL